MSPVHKRAAKSLPKNYRPITVVDNLSAVFEDVVKPQFEAWAKKFIPNWQYGFITECGTNDYGAALTLVIQDCLERRKQGVLIPSDIKGAFDRCWWARMKKRLKKLGMKKRALKLIYLTRRNAVSTAVLLVLSMWLNVVGVTISALTGSSAHVSWGLDNNGDSTTRRLSSPRRCV